MTVYLDTPVLLLAAGIDPPPAAVRVVQAIGSGALDAAISVEVVQELLHGSAWNRSRSGALTLVELTLRVFPHPHSVTAATMERSLTILRQAPRLGVRVATHLAAMAEAGLTEVISTDAEFGLWSGIRRYAPDDAIAAWRL